MSEPPKKDATPRPRQDYRASVELQQHHTPFIAVGVLPVHLRTYPTDPLTCIALSALLWDTGRARLRDLGIGPEAFDDDAGRIAAALMAERDFSADELRLLHRDDRESLTWGDTIDMFTLDPQWARNIIDKFAVAYASRWMPEVLKWAVDRMEQDHWTADRIAPELDRLLTLVRPSVLRAEQRAA